jgi:modulator of FtsH protease
MTASADWQDFAEMIGSASGALTGLLFVAVSLNASHIGGHKGLRTSAAQTLALFLVPLFMAAALLAPRQPDWALGAELITIGVLASVALLTGARVKRGLAEEDRRVIVIFDHRATNVAVMLLFVASGIVLACGQGAGLYLLLPASMLAFFSGVLNAWHFLLPPPEAQPKP